MTGGHIRGEDEEEKGGKGGVACEGWWSKASNFSQVYTCLSPLAGWWWRAVGRRRRGGKNGEKEGEIGRYVPLDGPIIFPSQL